MAGAAARAVARRPSATTSPSAEAACRVCAGSGRRSSRATSTGACCASTRSPRRVSRVACRVAASSAPSPSRARARALSPSFSLALSSCRVLRRGGGSAREPERGHQRTAPPRGGRPLLLLSSLSCERERRTDDVPPRRHRRGLVSSRLVSFAPCGFAPGARTGLPARLGERRAAARRGVRQASVLLVAGNERSNAKRRAENQDGLASPART